MTTRTAAGPPAPGAVSRIRVQSAAAPSAGASPYPLAASPATRRAPRESPEPPDETRQSHPGAGSETPGRAAGAGLAERYARQIALFGQAGQERLTEASVVLIGLGGLGSHLAQQLAFLGVRRYALLDGETVGKNSLSRLIGATGDDIGTPRAHVAARLIRSIQPAADVSVVAGPVPAALLDSGAAIGSATAVIAGVGSDTVRFILTELCSIAGVPYIDAASGASRADGDIIYGGRVVVAGLAAGCLFCRGELDRREGASAAVTSRRPPASAASQGAAEPRGGGASVVTINGVVASLAATEIACLISGLRPPCGMLTYRAHQGIVTRGGDLPAARHCPYCARWAASRRYHNPDPG